MPDERPRQYSRNSKVRKNLGDNSNNHFEHFLYARYTQALLYFIHPVTYKVGTIIISILHRRKLKPQRG